MADIYGQYSEKVEKLIDKGRQASELDYLRENCLVLFVSCEGKDKHRINYCQGTEVLGYSRK
jgi:hypothetical protein